MKEKIRIITWTNGYYGATEDGNIYRLKNKDGVILSVPKKVKCSGERYKQFWVCILGKKKKCSVHRIIAELFVQNPNNLPCVNHIDENKFNNSASNLEWCTYKENINHGTCIERRSNNRCKRIIQKSESGEIINTFRNISDAAAYFNRSVDSIRRILLCERPNKYNLHYI